MSIYYSLPGKIWVITVLLSLGLCASVSRIPKIPPYMQAKTSQDWNKSELYTWLQLDSGHLGHSISVVDIKVHLLILFNLSDCSCSGARVFVSITHCTDLSFIRPISSISYFLNHKIFWLHGGPASSVATSQLNEWMNESINEWRIITLICTNNTFQWIKLLFA